ncbi:hypothetical protein, partial [Escherichia coli]|uniref:hypothetical protein n=1 Tax=Enterobacteriaceae TaxID=543 RepID=UPI00126036D5
MRGKNSFFTQHHDFVRTPIPPGDQLQEWICPISANLRVVVLRLILFNVPMNYSHDNWSAILAHIGKPEELDT